LPNVDATGVAPLLLLIICQFKRAVKKAAHELRRNQAEVVAVEMYGLQSVARDRSFRNTGSGGRPAAQASQAAVQSALQARRLKSSPSPVVSLPVAFCTAFVLWRGAHIWRRNHPRRPNARIPGSLRGEIVFEDVAFRY
jgi:subfamily B ATP-binding cassette protein MsbA